MASEEAYANASVIYANGPETFYSNVEAVNQFSSHTASRNMSPKVVPYPRERPERPGETHSEYSEDASRRQSIEENYEDGIEESRRTDQYGFYTDEAPAIPRKINLDQLRRREKKWLHMMDNWSHFMDEEYDKVRIRCRKGIPPSLRARAWKLLSGASFQSEISMNRQVFDYCVRQPGDVKVIDEIERDLDRQFPQHELFARSGKYSEGGKEDLLNLLKAYTVLHPEEGYCQGQAPIASVLLMHMPIRDAFYVFVQICHKYLNGYYSPGLETVQLDGDILMQVLKEKNKTCYSHFKRHGIDAPLFMIEWFMCLYCRTLPWPTVLRIWDMFLCEGIKVVFRVALVLLQGTFGTNAQCKKYNDLSSILTRLRNLPSEMVEEETLMKKSFTMVREIVITTEEQIPQSNGVEIGSSSTPDSIEEEEEAIGTRIINGSKNIWRSIPNETKWFFYDFIIAMISLLVLFSLTVVGRVVVEYTHQEDGFTCRLVQSVDGFLGTSLTQSFCAAQLDLIERLSWNADNLSNEITEGVSTFIHQISDGVSAFHTIIGSVITYYAHLISDAFSELGGNMEENIDFLKQFIARGMEWLSSNLSSFLTSFQEALAPSH
ncbi:hypothetical protein PFISCL1PPCAC_10627 [Pristionchus fissidentatus]|uniref:Rab-GAP TBC domain-containing protein n=1 Tax=Pristionchus fissidentatus TaxID=1538716 RepID=A0AAV5VL17_9BILA|nr:hypothetical protein PFISCL1PPCAC_10627 [Pristionchus fissidentatus]